MDNNRINADFSQRVIVETDALPWVPSPQAGVERRMLDRVGDEVARATSLVRYAPGSEFPGHAHDLGEEFLVLDGVFADEHGDYPAGTYVRNPPGSTHAPRTPLGCVIFVKLRQMTPDETRRVVIDTNSNDWQPGTAPGHSVQALFSSPDGTERVTLERLDRGAGTYPEGRNEGEEILLLEGDLSDGLGSYRSGTWIRSPASAEKPLHSTSGALFWRKRGQIPATG